MTADTVYQIANPEIARFGGKKLAKPLCNLLRLKCLNQKEQEASLVSKQYQLGFKFPGLGRRKIEANFEGGQVSSDGGVMLVRQADAWRGLSKRTGPGLAGRGRRD